MNSFPSNQNISQYIGNSQAAPDVNKAPSIGAQSGVTGLPNSGAGVQPSSTLSPQTLMVNSVMQSPPNSATNHSIGNGGWSTSYSPYGSMTPQNQLMIQALRNGA